MSGLYMPSFPSLHMPSLPPVLTAWWPPSWMAVCVGVLLVIALVLGIVAVTRPSQSVQTYSQRCAAALDSGLLTDPLEVLMPDHSKAIWISEANGGAPLQLPTGTLLPSVKSMEDGSPMPQDLMCQLAAGCTAGKGVQVTPDGACYVLFGGAKGWAVCSPADRAGSSGVQASMQNATCPT